MLPTIAREDDTVVMVDQRKLPAEEVYVHCKTAAEVARAIKTMVIRGAPAIGVAAAMGIAVGVRKSKATGTQKVAAEFYRICELMAATRLTAWELVRDGIPTTVITDNMAGALMRQGRVNFVVVGADRIAANGDTANKIGTYGVAVLAREHNIPFYVAAPLSTIDLSTPDGSRIPIEERSAKEVTHIGGAQLAPDGAAVWNPAFDVTPHHLIAGIITERGIFRPPYIESLKRAFEDQLALHHGAHGGHRG